MRDTGSVTYDSQVMEWVLNFILHDLPFSEQLKLIERIEKWKTLFERKGTDETFAGVIGLSTISQVLNKEILLDYRPCAKLGRLANGGQLDHGQIVHAVNKFGALCGTKPGRKSIGWSEPDYDHVTCPACLERIVEIEKIKAKK